jgi:hypothetical protein
MRREQRAANVQKMKRPFHHVEVGIDELVLHGFPVADRYLIGDALMQELGHLFETSETNDLLTNQAHIPALNAGRIVLPSNGKPASVGTQVAQAVYGSLNHGNGGNRQ